MCFIIAACPTYFHLTEEIVGAKIVAKIEMSEFTFERCAGDCQRWNNSSCQADKGTTKVDSCECIGFSYNYLDYLSRKKQGSRSSSIRPRRPCTMYLATNEISLAQSKQVIKSGQGYIHCMKGRNIFSKITKYNQ